MNILPKKRWHVRTKDNVARVRRDEAKAAAEELRAKQRVALAEQEFRTNVLRGRAADRKDAEGVVPIGEEEDRRIIETIETETGHINLFADLEADDKKASGTNKEYEKEKKEDKEAEERKIGLLRYLGEGSTEFMKATPWYQKAPERKTDQIETTNRKSRSTAHLPAFVVAQQFKPSPIVTSKPSSSSESRKRKHKKHKKHSKKKKHRRLSSSSDETDSNKHSISNRPNLESLRAERLRRETNERQKSEQLLRKMRGEKEPEKTKEVKSYNQRYSSQFNPEFAKQNK